MVAYRVITPEVFTDFHGIFWLSEKKLSKEVCNEQTLPLCRRSNADTDLAALYL